MPRRSPPRKVTYFKPVLPRLARNTIIESTFEVGRRFRCTMRVDCGRDGQVSVFMVREIINAAFRESNREFTAEEIDAIDTFRATAQRLQFETRLEPGEASFLNNYTVMHARSEFDDWDEPEMKRLMLRLWLDVERKARPVVREIHIYENAGGRSGIDPQPGRLPAVAKYRAPDVEVRRQAAAE